MTQRSCRRMDSMVARLVAVATLAVVTAVLGPAVAEASGSEKVEFTVTLQTEDDADDPEVSDRKTRRVAGETVDRIEQRLEAIDIPHHEIEAAGADIDITVFGDYSPQLIKAVVIPDGRFEVRPLLVDSSPWLGVAPKLPEGVEFYNEPGAMDPDSFFLFSHTPARLHRAIDLVSTDDHTIKVFPHDEGWRTLRLGPVLATHDDIRDVRLERNPTGAPFVNADLDAEAAQQIRSGVERHRARQLAMIVDGEVVALETFSDRSFSESMTIEPPGHLESTGAERNWARQVAGRLAVDIPVRVAEFEE